MKQYNIKKGKYYADGFNYGLSYNKTLINVNVMFDETCLYTLEENFDQVNKLIGVSQGMHHQNS